MRWRDADDAQACALDQDGFSIDIGVRVKLPLPEIMADDHCGSILRAQSSSYERLNSQRFEVVR